MSLAGLALGAAAAALVLAAPAAAGADWLRAGGDDQLTNSRPGPLYTPAGARLLTPQWSIRLGGPIVASPLYAAGVDVGGGTRDLVVAATESGDVDAVDADTGDLVWSRRTSTATHADCLPSAFGVSGSPVLDRATSTVYAVDAAGLLHGLDLATGAERQGYPFALLARPDLQYVWGGLTLVGGRLVVPVASYCDLPDHAGEFADGGLLGVDVTAAPAVVSTFDVAPGPGNLGGIWGYGGTSVDPATGDVWTATGNSWTYDDTCGCIVETAGYAESIVDLSPALAPLASDRPAGIPSPETDTDFGSAPLLFQPAGCPPLAAAHSKNGSLYVWERGALADGPRWSSPIGGNDVDEPFIGEPSWSAALQELVVGDAHWADAAGTGTDGVAAFRVGAGCTFPDDPSWQTAAGSGTRPPVLLVGGVVVAAGGTQPTLTVLAATDGSLLWQTALDGPDFAPPILAGDSVVAGSGAGTLSAYAPADPWPSRDPLLGAWAA